MHHGIRIPTYGDYADARVQAELAREAEQPGWDGVFLSDDILFWTSKRVELFGIRVLRSRLGLGAVD